MHTFSRTDRTSAGGHSPWRIAQALYGLVLLIVASHPPLVLASEVSCDDIPISSVTKDLSVSQPPLVDGPTLVDIELSITELTGIDVRNGRFQFQAYANFGWCDPRQAFDPVENGSPIRVYVGSDAQKMQEKIWATDLSMVNEVSGIRVRKRELMIRDDGRVSLRGYFSAHLAAQFDLTKFPFDSQTLPIQVESLTWSEDVVRLRNAPDSVDVQQDFELAEWAVGAVSGTVSSVARGSSATSFARLDINTTIHRRVGYYLWKAALPLALIVALGWTVFWMPDGLGTRVRLSATVMLTIVAYQFALASDLPKVAGLTLFSAFMTVSFLTIALTVIVNVSVFYRESRGDESIVRRSDQLCRWLIPALYTTSVAAVVTIYLS